MDPYTKKLFHDFVFHDCRLKDHPKVRASVSEVSREKLVLAEHTAPQRGLIAQLKVNPTLKVPSISFRNISLLERSVLAVPLLYGENVVGVLSFDTFENEFFKEKDIGHARLLAAILAYSKSHVESSPITPASIALGTALKKVREEVGLTQAELAERIESSRIAISRWEGGAQPPTLSFLYKWCEGLGLFSPTSTALVTFVDVTPRLLEMLREDPARLRELSPSQFEQFVAERLDRIGFDVTLTGATSHRDGGIDLIAVPKVRTVGAFLLAAQVKHHRGDQKTGRDAVDRLLAWKDSPFRLGLLVTNTGFTRDAQWVADQVGNKSFLRLRDLTDLKRWIEDNFSSEEDWEEIPDEIQLAPGVSVRIPRPKLVSSSGLGSPQMLDRKTG